jgi:pyruvate/2-oxoglutarate dehydrogenase complex dihydrolipoamide acyltransferase (E2) component
VEEVVPGTQLLSETTNEAGQTVQRSVDESGDIVETTLDESGNLVDENIVANVTELSSEEEYTNEEGNTVRTVREEGGKLLHLQLGPEGSLLDLALPDLGDTVEEITEESTEQYEYESQSETTEEEPDATGAARQRAEQLGVDLSEVEGSGAGGRITVKDVVSAASQ